MKTLNLDEAAKFFRAGKSTVATLAAAGHIPATKSGRVWFFQEEDLVDYLKAQIRAQTCERAAWHTAKQVLNRIKRRSERTPQVPR